VLAHEKWDTKCTAYSEEHWACKRRYLRGISGWRPTFCQYAVGPIGAWFEGLSDFATHSAAHSGFQRTLGVVDAVNEQTIPIQRTASETACASSGAVCGNVVTAMNKLEAPESGRAGRPRNGWSACSSIRRSQTAWLLPEPGTATQALRGAAVPVDCLQTLRA